MKPSELDVLEATLARATVFGFGATKAPALSTLTRLITIISKHRREKRQKATAT